MKKFLLSLLTCFLLTTACFADCSKCTKSDCACGADCSCKQKCENKLDTTKHHCDKCSIEDDEYCVYNQCYFDKHYTYMKKSLCLTRQQEACIDTIYKNFKADMENQCALYKTEKNKLLSMIECGNDCWRNQRKVLKQICKESKQKCKNFDNDVKEQLCKNQYSEYRRFKRHEKKKMKRIVKYGKIVKLPCSDCCK